MQKGGNETLHAFFEKYDFNNVSSPNLVTERYLSKAAEYYRNRLNALASEDQQLITDLLIIGEPSYSQGLESILTGDTPTMPDPQSYDGENGEVGLI